MQLTKDMIERNEEITQYVKRVTEGNTEERQEHLARALEEVVDPELTMLLGSYVTALVLPRLVEVGLLTLEQERHIIRSEIETLQTINTTRARIGKETESSGTEF